MNFLDHPLSSHVVATPNRRRYHMTRALRYATIALFLAAGFEGLNLDCIRQHYSAIRRCRGILFSHEYQKGI